MVQAALVRIGEGRRTFSVRRDRLLAPAGTSSRKKYHVSALDRPPQRDGQVALSGSRRHAASRRYRHRTETGSVSTSGKQIPKGGDSNPEFPELRNSDPAGAGSKRM